MQDTALQSTTIASESSGPAMSIPRRDPQQPAENTMNDTEPTALEQANAQASTYPKVNAFNVADLPDTQSALPDQATSDPVAYTPDDNDTDHSTKDHENVPHEGTSVSPWSITPEAPKEASDPVADEKSPTLPQEFHDTDTTPHIDVTKAAGISHVSPEITEPELPDTLTTATTETSRAELPKKEAAIPMEMSLAETIKNLEALKITTEANIKRETLLLTKIDGALELLRSQT